MVEIDAHDVAAMLSTLLRRVAAGEEITITSSGYPVARLVPAPRGPERVFGQDCGLFTMPDDFDAPLPDQVLATFGESSPSASRPFQQLSCHFQQLSCSNRQGAPTPEPSRPGQHPPDTA